MKKMGITRPRPDGGVKKKKKSSRGINPAVVLSTIGVQNTLRPRKIQAKWCKFLKLVIYRTFNVFAMIA